MKWTSFTWAWIVWILGFGAIEAKALMNKDKGDTLSEHIWWIAGTKTQQKKWYNWLARVILGAGFAWLIPHFFSGWSP